MIRATVVILALLVASSSARLGGFIAGGFRITPGFSCEGRLLGFYADVANDCRAYHVCEPVVDEFGQTLVGHYTFMCGPNTSFDQRLLLCNHQRKSFPCSEAESIYEETNLQLRIEEEERQREAYEKRNRAIEFFEE
ncbi:uncharacterized protein LOC135216429 [Macrobrachium nipponense]|uniref:uncharacterized protein LOC135216429 n=1 Tax=Macrobrachium nipponense TaxID=159736 RepID=UPI0030C89AA0